MALTEPSTGAKVVLGVFGLICFAVFAVYWLAVAAWLYQAAEKAGFHGILWLMLALASNLFAAVLFILLRSFLTSKCGACGTWQDKKRKYCTVCGAAMHRTCPGCGTECKSGDSYCHGCGKKLDSSDSAETTNSGGGAS